MENKLQCWVSAIALKLKKLGFIILGQQHLTQSWQQLEEKTEDNCENKKNKLSWFEKIKHVINKIMENPTRKDFKDISAIKKI